MAELEKAACDIETLELTSKWAELFLPLLGTLLKNLKKKTYLHIMLIN